MISYDHMSCLSKSHRLGLKYFELTYKCRKSSFSFERLAGGGTKLLFILPPVNFCFCIIGISPSLSPNQWTIANDSLFGLRNVLGSCRLIKAISYFLLSGYSFLIISCTLGGMLYFSSVSRRVSHHLIPVSLERSSASVPCLPSSITSVKVGQSSQIWD